MEIIDTLIVKIKNTVDYKTPTQWGRALKYCVNLLEKEKTLIDDYKNDTCSECNAQSDSIKEFKESIFELVISHNELYKKHFNKSIYTSKDNEHRKKLGDLLKKCDFKFLDGLSNYFKSKGIKCD